MSINLADPRLYEYIEDFINSRPFGGRARAFLRANCKYVGDVVALSYAKLMCTPNIGQGTRSQIALALAQRELAFGDVPEWPPENLSDWVHRYGPKS